MPQDDAGLSKPRVFHAAARLGDGRIVVTGGRRPRGSASPTVDLFDPKTLKWTAGPAMPVGRWGHTLTVFSDGRVLAVGSKGAGCAILDPHVGTWTPTESTRTERYLHTATLLKDGRVLVAGGRAADTLASVEIWNPKTGTWSAAPDMARARYYHTATLLADGRVLVAGGIEDRNLDAAPHDHCEVFDPVTHAWSPVGSLKTARLWHGAERLNDGRVLVVGGYRQGRLVSCELFDPRTGEWTNGPELREGRYDMPTVRLADG